MSVVSQNISPKAIAIFNNAYAVVNKILKEIGLISFQVQSFLFSKNFFLARKGLMNFQNSLFVVKPLQVMSLTHYSPVFLKYTLSGGMYKQNLIVDGYD